MNRLLVHVLAALYPRTEHLPGIVDTGLAEFLPRLRREAAPLLRLGLYAGCVLFVLCPLFTVYVPLPSFLLPRRLLDRHADRITQVRPYAVRSLMMLVKMAAGLCWGADPAVRAQFGLPPLPADPQGWRTT
ncbi:MAG: hypothetical protein U1A78_26795 [Polyangia bacterium]